eukprot:scaffold106544_cov19-Tisochrysis_lutea.AAC.3
MALGLSSLHLDFYSQTAKKCMHRLLHTSDTQYVSMSDQPGYWPVGFLVHILWNKGWVKRLKHQAKEHQVWPLGSLSPLLNPHLTDAQFVNSFDGCSLPNLTCDPFLVCSGLHENLAQLALSGNCSCFGKAAIAGGSALHSFPSLPPLANTCNEAPKDHHTTPLRVHTSFHAYHASLAAGLAQSHRCVQNEPNSGRSPGSTTK